MSNNQMQFKKLKSYHGTIWLCAKWDENNKVAYSIHSHWKTAKENIQYGYDVKKVVLTPYKEYMKQFEDVDEDIDLSGIPPTALF